MSDFYTRFAQKNFFPNFGEATAPTCPRLVCLWTQHCVMSCETSDRRIDKQTERQTDRQYTCRESNVFGDYGDFVLGDYRVRLRVALFNKPQMKLIPGRLIRQLLHATFHSESHRLRGIGSTAVTMTSKVNGKTQI